MYTHHRVLRFVFSFFQIFFFKLIKFFNFKVKNGFFSYNILWLQFPVPQFLPDAPHLSTHPNPLSSKPLSFSLTSENKQASKNKIKEEIERYSILRTVSAVERADVVVLVIDATEGVTEQDAKIAGIAHDRGRGMIIVVNKWDAVEKDNHSVKEYTNRIRNVLSFMPYAEILFISAKTGQRLPKLFDVLEVVIQNHQLRIATGVLNDILTEAVAMQQPPSDKGRRLKIYYMTQVSVKPPAFVLFVNDKKLMHFSYTRYLENKLREAFGFSGTSLKFYIRERKEK